MNEINRRNTESVFARLKEIDARVREQEMVLRQIQDRLTALIGRYQETEHKVNVMRVAGMGHGPTEK
jgi:uncharacterized coiled-coil protein SlyX